ncbi:MAG: GAF domain-containing protein [Verrucomicrobiales bacterium]|nr:GAF domain-containing protein [Verrucomicrobiales bacterium]
MSLRVTSISQSFPSAASTVDWSALLASIAAGFSCQAGTLHRLDPESKRLRLLAQQGIPEFLHDKIDGIPIGKGIAGAAAQKAAPVQMCNLQTDNSGVARPDARLTKVEGTLAVPILTSDGAVCGVLGIGKLEPYDFPPDEIADLEAVATAVAALFHH